MREKPRLIPKGGTMTPEEYQAFKAKNDELRAAASKRAANDRRRRAERKIPRNQQLNLEQVKLARKVLRKAAHQ